MRSSSSIVAVDWWSMIGANGISLVPRLETSQKRSGRRALADAPAVPISRELRCASAAGVAHHSPIVPCHPVPRSVRSLRGMVSQRQSSESEHQICSALVAPSASVVCAVCRRASGGCSLLSAATRITHRDNSTASATDDGSAGLGPAEESDGCHPRDTRSSRSMLSDAPRSGVVGCAVSQGVCSSVVAVSPPVVLRQAPPVRLELERLIPAGPSSSLRAPLLHSRSAPTRAHASTAAAAASPARGLVECGWMGKSPPCCMGSSLDTTSGASMRHRSVQRSAHCRESRRPSIFSPAKMWPR